jgi:hypothetical protein
LFTILDDLFPSTTVVTIISSLVIAIFIVGLAVSRYYTRRKKQVDDSSYSVTRYWRRQLASTSCDNFTPSPTINNNQSSQNVNETTRIIKNSFSWPEANMLHRQQEEHAESSSTISSLSLSNSSTIENILEPTSLTFGLRWDEITKSLFVRVVSARDLLIHRHNRQPTLIDSYVRVELIPNSTDNTEGSFFLIYRLHLLFFFIKESFPSMRTHIIRKNAYPVYDELFEYSNLEQLINDKYSLIFTLLTYDTFTRDEIVGEVMFPITLNILDSTEMTFTQTITPRHKQVRKTRKILDIYSSEKTNIFSFLVMESTTWSNASFFMLSTS